MGHDKLRKFEENKHFRCLLQPSADEVLVRGGEGLQLKDHPVKGRWNAEVFGAERPIVLELGCGKGEYTIALAERHPQCHFIGVDIKGARLWKGAKYATEKALPNVAFLRTRIEFISAFFAPGEVSEIWLTFSDPQLKSENSRLTSPLFLERYRRFLRPDGRIHLKTDSRFLHEYSLAVAQQNGFPVHARTTDLYGPERIGAPEELFSVRTFYEQMFLDMGLPITYLCFGLDHDAPYRYPDFDADHWRKAEGPRRSFSHAPAKNGSSRPSASVADQ